MVRIAAQRYTDQDRRTLTEIMEQMSQSTRSLTGDKPAQFDLQFHVALARATQNRVFVHMINGLRWRLVIWMDKAVNNPAAAEKAVYEHNHILEAVFSRD